MTKKFLKFPQPQKPHDLETYVSFPGNLLKGTFMYIFSTDVGTLFAFFVRNATSGKLHPSGWSGWSGRSRARSVRAARICQKFVRNPNPSEIYQKSKSSQKFKNNFIFMNLIRNHATASFHCIYTLNTLQTLLLQVHVK